MIFLNTVMTLRTPQLALKRLVVQWKGIAVYDEKFRHGINIIRGTNSSGKSTIADFIFYVLGGEIPIFKLEAERCEEVVAEVEINGQPITIRRIIKPGGKQPMLISYKNFASAMASPVEGWEVYSMQRSTHKESASQALFRFLGFPEVKTDTENSITMHQVLRLIYADQLSPVSSLMREERFDPPLVRQTVGDLLYGIYDDALYGELRELRDKNKALDAVKAQLDGLYRAIGSTEFEIDEGALKTKLEKLTQEQTNIDDTIRNSGAADFDKNVPKEVKKHIEGLTEELRSQKLALSKALEEANSLELEIADSEAFINELVNRISAIDNSVITRRSFGELPVTHCPQCLSHLIPPEDKNLCVLCGSELPKSPTDSSALKMKQELAQQLKESRHLLDDKVQALALLQAEIPKLKGLAKSKQRQYDDAVEKVRPARDERIDQLFVRKGELIAEIENIHKQSKIVNVVKDLEANKTALASAIQSLGMSIERRKRTQSDRRIIAESKIEEHTVNLLRNDLHREDTFKLGKHVQVDFGNNTFAIDGRNQFSASSIVYLKNSVHFGIFFASLDLDFFRYPRFILCDNIEDKGMEQARSRNFQKLIVKLSEASKVQHQIIFTTSMIDPSLNEERYCVGPEYNENRKTLNFPKVSVPPRRTAPLDPKAG